MNFTQQIQLTPNSELRGLYVKVPFYIDFKLFLFNLTNPEEFAQGKLKLVLHRDLEYETNGWNRDVFLGGKARLEEIGPYFFE